MTQSAMRGARLGFDEAARLDADEQPGEVVGGRWTPVTRGTWRHGRVTANVVFALKLYAKDHPGWSVATADPGTKLALDPPLLRGPDAAIVRAEREPTGRGADGWLEGAPDVAVEVMGDDQTLAEVMRKALEYIRAGARMIWLLDAEAEQVVIVTAPNLVRVLARDEVLDGGDTLPGFACAVADLFGP